MSSTTITYLPTELFSMILDKRKELMLKDKIIYDKKMAKYDYQISYRQACDDYGLFDDLIFKICKDIPNKYRCGYDIDIKMYDINETEAICKFKIDDIEYNKIYKQSEVVDLIIETDQPKFDGDTLDRFDDSESESESESEDEDASFLAYIETNGLNELGEVED
tara:strand:- start:899 stop:1390 length:492 start_codon:yes stop_codon:yes gene_type:complete